MNRWTCNKSESLFFERPTRLYAATLMWCVSGICPALCLSINMCLSTSWSFLNYDQCVCKRYCSVSPWVMWPVPLTWPRDWKIVLQTSRNKKKLKYYWLSPLLPALVAPCSPPFPNTHFHGSSCSHICNSLVKCLLMQKPSILGGLNKLWFLSRTCIPSNHSAFFIHKCSCMKQIFELICAHLLWKGSNSFQQEEKIIHSETNWKK